MSKYFLLFLSIYKHGYIDYYYVANVFDNDVKFVYYVQQDTNHNMLAVKW